jgi:hypothetical protein
MMSEDQYKLRIREDGLRSGYDIIFIVFSYLPSLLVAQVGKTFLFSVFRLRNTLEDNFENVY